MFHLLVKFDGWADGRDSLPVDRVFEHTDADLVPRSSEGTLDFERVSQIPALFATELRGTGATVARVGTISRARLSGQQVEIEYTLDGSVEPVPNAAIDRLTRELSIGQLELSRTHWAIKDVDLFKVLLANQSARTPSPTVFRLDNSGVVNSLLSVMMPFDARFEDVYASIHEAAGKMGMQCLRADDIWQNDALVQDVVSLICRSRIVVSDCTGRNANVFYETGVAHTLGRDVILITQSDADVPFDLRHLRFLPYLNNGEGRQGLTAHLEARIRTLLGRSQVERNS